MARKLKITVSGKKSDLIDRINVALSKN
jgi:hypothetical protein